MSLKLSIRGREPSRLSRLEASIALSRTWPMPPPVNNSALIVALGAMLLFLAALFRVYNHGLSGLEDGGGSAPSARQFESAEPAWSAGLALDKLASGLRSTKSPTNKLTNKSAFRPAYRSLDDLCAPVPPRPPPAAAPGTMDLQRASGREEVGRVQVVAIAVAACNGTSYR